MDNYELLSQIAENCHPKFIARIDGKAEIVGEVIDGVVYLTEAGKKLVQEQEPSKPAASKKAAKKVESANESASSADDDLSV